MKLRVGATALCLRPPGCFFFEQSPGSGDTLVKRKLFQIWQMFVMAG